MNLNVADLERSRTFYEDLGMDLVAEGPSSLFLSWDRYHHHVAINEWLGAGVDPVRPAVAGLASFSIRRPGLAHTQTDPDGIVVDAVADPV